MFRFEAPLALLLLLLLPWLVWAVHFRRGRGGVVTFSFRWWGGDGYSPGFQSGLLFSLVAYAGLWLGVGLLILALAGPTFVQRERVHLVRGLDIMMVLDESPSMKAEDLKPYRLAAAKGVIKEFIAGRENDAIGLVGFGTEAVLRIPPTLDYDLVLGVLETVDVSTLGEDTAIGTGLALASLHLRSGDAPGRVIILLTDGENNAGEISPDAAAAVAQDMGIRIYTVGLGREGMAELEFTDPETGQVIRGRIESQFDEDLLVGIAETSGGRYFSARSRAVLDAIFQEIDSIEKTEKRVRVVVNRQPLHPRFIVLGLILCVASFLIRKGLLEEML